MRSLTVAAAACLAAFALAPAARAKDVCIGAGGGTGVEYRLENPKLPKKPGKVTTLVGAARVEQANVDANAYGPLQGTAMLALDGSDKVVIALTVQAPAAVHQVHVTVDRSFEGIGNAVIGGVPNLETWNPFDCELSTLP